MGDSDLMRHEKEMRCFCRRKPLLATFGVDKNGTLFVHVKIYKANRIFGELIIEAGPVKIRCRECLRFHTIHFDGKRASLVATDQDVPQSVLD
jgi:hypothetical protein